jgi:esterase/lipase superfamily enzyme
MFIINARRSEQSNHAFTPVDHLHREPGPWEDSMEQQKENETVWAGDLFRAINGGRVLLLVHGYNTPIGDALQAFRRVAEHVHRRVPDAYDTVVGFTWPGGNARYTYPWARRRVPTAARHLRRWVDPLSTRSQSLDLFCYSLGTSVGRCALMELEAVRVRYVFAVAPALGVSLLKRTLRERTTPHPYDHLYAFYSQNDVTLGRWFWLMEGEPAIGYSIPDDVHDRLRALNVTPINFDHAVSGHTEYARSDALYDCIGQIVGGVRSVRTGEASRDRPLDRTQR